ncbi:MAG: LysR family transcriptional regulator [Dehalococcoidia bacterium]|nr:MAG: LysR family transcriptional regulator [Dehalococcoidia bacterium]
MNLEYLKTYIELVKLGNFSEVAKKFSLSQPAISFQIQKLEHDLGARLINRSQKRITLTDAGKRLLEFANTVISESDKMANDLDRLRQEISGELVIVASTIPSEFMLPSLLSEFIKLNPAVKAKVETRDSLTAIAGLKDGIYEVGFCGVVPPTGHELESFKIAEDDIVPIVFPDHPLAKKSRISFAELQGESLIFREDTSGTQKSLETLLLKAGLDIRLLSPRLVLSNTQALVSAVESGIGIAFVSNLAIKKSIELGLVKKLTLENLKLRRDFHCIYRREKLESRLFKEFISFVQTKTPIEV